MMTQILTNKGLITLLDMSNIVGKPSDHIKLPDMIEAAEFINAEGCYFIECLYRNRGNATLELLHDETGFECYVNHIHLDEYGSVERLGIALRICAVIEEKWLKSGYRSITLRQIVSHDEDSCVYRCHVLRESQCWLSANLVEYQELIVVIDSATVEQAAPKRGQRELIKEERGETRK